MKKILYSTAFLCALSLATLAQGQGSGSGGSLNASSQWKTNGNIAQTTDFIGTTNQQSLIFKSYNTKILELTATGDIIFSRLIDGTGGGGGGIVKVGGGGQGGRIDFTNNFSHVLNGQGIFTDISTFTGLKVSGNDIIQTTTGNIGIGIATPGAKLSVAGTGSFTGNVDATSLSLAGGQADIRYAAPNTGFGNVTILSFLKGGPVNPDPPCIMPPIGSTVNQFSDAIQIHSTYNNSLTRLTMGYDGLNHYIDGSGTNPTVTGRPSTLINWYCGNDVAICNNFANNGGTNGQGGVVSVGMHFQIGNPAYDGNTAFNLKCHVNGAINVNGVVDHVFTVANNGNTRIGIKKPMPGFHDNSTLTVFGDVTTTAVYVTDPNSKWSDFVFDNNYKLMPLEDLEKFYLKNHHLPDVPTTKDIQTEGNNLAETDAILLQKIEELTLYVVQLQKTVEAQKLQIKHLEKKVGDK